MCEIITNFFPRTVPHNLELVQTGVGTLLTDIVSGHLLVSSSVSRAVVFLLLFISGDVEQNPGPTGQGLLWLYN